MLQTVTPTITSAQTTTSVSHSSQNQPTKPGRAWTTAAMLPASDDVALATVTRPTVSAHPANSTASVGRRERLASEAEEKKRTVVRDPGSMRASVVPASVMCSIFPDPRPASTNLASRGWRWGLARSGARGEDEWMRVFRTLRAGAPLAGGGRRLAGVERRGARRRAAAFLPDQGGDLGARRAVRRPVLASTPCGAWASVLVRRVRGGRARGARAPRQDRRRRHRTGVVVGTGGRAPPRVPGGDRLSVAAPPRVRQMPRTGNGGAGDSGRPRSVGTGPAVPALRAARRGSIAPARRAGPGATPAELSGRDAARRIDRTHPSRPGGRSRTSTGPSPQDGGRAGGVRHRRRGGASSATHVRTRPAQPPRPRQARSTRRGGKRKAVCSSHSSEAGTG